MRVHLVDDERGLVRALQRGLIAEGFAVDVAYDGPTGLTMATDTDYDAVVLDVMLLRRDGYDVVTSLRERGVTRPEARAQRRGRHGVDGVLPRRERRV